MTEARGPSSKIELRVLRPHQTATVRETVGRDDIPAAIGRIFQAVTQATRKQRIEHNGSPFARYHSFGDLVDLEAGVPVKSPILPEGTVKPSDLPGGPAAIAVHAGPYEGLADTYAAIEAWLASTGRTASGGPWEIYLTDPSTEPDPGKWLTEVIYPLQKP
jgi:effector-binding domain-containing protein